MSIRVRRSLERLANDLGGDHAVGDPITTKAKRELAARHLPNGADVSEPVLGFAKGSGPPVIHREIDRGKHLSKPFGQAIGLRFQEAIAPVRIPKGIVFTANQSATIV